MRFFLFLFFISVSALYSAAQQLNMPLNYQSSKDKFSVYPFHSCRPSRVPVVCRSHKSFRPLQTHLGQPGNNSQDSIAFEKKWFTRKLRHESFVVIDTGDFFLTIDPLFRFELGLDMADSTHSGKDKLLFVNQRGLRVQANLGSKVSFSSSFYENQAFLPSYLSDFVDLYDVAPGQGRVKTFKNRGFDYAMASGYVSYSPNNKINIQFGHDKHFIGNGYRSLILSDNSFNYPFLRVTNKLGRFQFTNLYTSFKNTNVPLPTSPTTERRFQSKYATIQEIACRIGRFEFAMFEAVMWNGFESGDWISYINPISMVRPFQFGLNGDVNVLLGLNSNYRISRTAIVYSQAVLDDYTANKWALQIGIKGQHLFRVKGLYGQLEYNTATPYTYGHIDSTVAFTNYNQALSHPLGAAFDEVMGFLSYEKNGFFVNLKLQYASYLEDSLQTHHFGKDLFKSDITAEKNEGEEFATTLINQHLELGYTFNKNTNLQAFFGFVNRTELNDFWENHTQYVHFGLRTNLLNVYSDF